MPSNLRPRASFPARLARVVGALGGLALWSAAAAAVAAHGPVPDEAPTIGSLLLGWSFEPVPTLGILAAVAWWWWAVRRVNALHPANPVPRRRSVAFGLGMFAIAFALMSGVGRYDTSLFSVHMVQHVLLLLVAAPLIALSAPVTLLLRLSSHETRQRWILPALHSRIARAVGYPVVTWILFATVMWVTHFSPLFDAALEDPFVHDLEHGLFLVAALLFWWPAVALDPGPWRMPHPGRVLYVFMQMPQNTFLAVVILNATTVLYHHYATLQRTWGPPPLEDQHLAAAVMWLAGDGVFIAALFALIYGWMKAEGRDTGRIDRRAATELAEIRRRETRLAERLAGEREDAQPGSGALR